MNSKLLLTTLIFTLFSCTSTSPSRQAEDTINKLTRSEQDQKHFKIEKKDGNTLITVQEPFLGSKHKETYLLYKRKTNEPKIEATHKIPYPVQRVAIHSTTHIGFLSEINQINSVKAASNLSLYYDSTFNKNIEQGSVKSIGNRSLDYEALVNSKVDLIFSFVIDASGMKEVEKLRSLGQRVILISEYMEHNPLDKAEWVKVFAAFFDQETQEKADTIFEQIQKDYHQSRNEVSLYSFKPSVMIGFPWKGTWYVSGGDSYQAALIRDANGRYLWEQVSSAASVPLTLEKIYQDALEADVWINPSTKQTYREILEENENFDSFKAFKSRKIYTNYKRSNEKGANDYWESGVVHPERILKDLSVLLRNDTVKKEELFYYKPLQ